MPENKEQTNVQQVDFDLNSWLSAPSGENVITQEKPKPSIFKKEALDLSFIETIKEEENKEEKKETLETIINEIDPKKDEELETEEEKAKKGRPTTDKSGLVEFFKKRIESKEMFTFDDYDETKQSLDEYLGSLSSKDLDELYTANINQFKEEVSANTPKEFFESLPSELQYAAQYVLDGGRDLKGLFQALAHVEQTRELSPANDGDQEQIIRSYLLATNFGTDEEISDEITNWKDLGILEKRAKQFKPKLDKMQEEQVAQRLAAQEQKKIQSQQAAKAYMDNVFEALRPGEINGLKLEKNTQAKLYAGLTQAQYPSMNGRPTNLLGHLLEKYQFEEPNYSIIAEALWLLSDPEDYRKTIAKGAKNQATEEIARQLKIEQTKKSSSTGIEDEGSKTKKISRGVNQNFFKR